MSNKNKNTYLVQNQRVFVGMSGGVDSSVAALLLKESGYDVTGVFMRCYNIDGCAERDADDARRVAENLDIPFYVWDFEDEYKERVVQYMVEGYRSGITPNPDIACNREIKFGLFLKKALSLGADYVATGHYTRRRREIRNPKSEIRNKHQISNHKYKMFAAKDDGKDQSYFLWTLTQDDLKHCLFPLGDYLKSEVRDAAKRAGLPTADKKDSQGICFLGQVNLVDFLSEYISKNKGDIIDTEGNKLGEHEGAAFYTIGQRRGLDLAQKNAKLGISGATETKPHYVVNKNIETNTIIVAEGEKNPSLYRDHVDLIDVNFINPEENKNFDTMKVRARIRYRQPLFQAKLEKVKTRNLKPETRNKSQIPNLKPGTYKLVFDEPQRFISPGQSAVFYNEDGVMIGGGVIV